MMIAIGIWDWDCGRGLEMGIGNRNYESEIRTWGYRMQIWDVNQFRGLELEN